MAIASSLRAKWESDGEDFDPEAVAEWLYDTYNADVKNFYAQFLKDAGVTLRGKMSAFSIPKQAIFTEHIKGVMHQHIEEAKRKVSLACLDLKWAFLSKLDDYVQGKADKFEMSQIVDWMGQQSVRYGRFFARDSMARFNKALTLATYGEAGVTKVRWCTCHDSRVRDTHRALDGKVFDINNLPPEKDDYNCRCGLIPVEYAD